jgi:uncharacterized protein YigE (DUF2233 family)
MIYNKANFSFAGKAIAVFLLILVAGFSSGLQSSNDKIVSYTVDPEKTDLRFYHSDKSGKPFKSILALKQWLAQRHQTLLFAMNGGMYKTGSIPQGLYIEEKRIITPLDTSSASGNFYLKPNGVFYITGDNKAAIVSSLQFKGSDIRFATQSGPMLVINGSIHPAFNKTSTNLYIRNGVGILPGGNVIFAISKEPVNFYEFAEFFKDSGCSNALYLDGFVSRMWLPEKNWMQTDGDFGVIIGVTKK